MRGDDDGLGAAQAVANALAPSLVLWAIILVLLREMVLWMRG